MANQLAILGQLGSIFEDTFYIQPPPPDTDLIESDILDSFQFAELLYRLEQHFNLDVDTEKVELDDVRTLERIAQLVARALASVGAGRLKLEVRQRGVAL
jgi:acyl carrier protein